MDFATRYDFLKTAIARYDSYYNLAAVKASLLLTSNAILLAPGLGEKSQFLRLAGPGGAGRVFMIVAAVLSLLSIAYAALVIASTVTRRAAAGYRSLMFTESVASLANADYVAGIAGMNDDAVIDDMARLAHLLAGGVTRKFRYVNISLAALVGAVICAFLGLLA